MFLTGDLDNRLRKFDNAKWKIVKSKTGFSDLSKIVTVLIREQCASPAHLQAWITKI